jgi:hypothetical protein
MRHHVPHERAGRLTDTVRMHPLVPSEIVVASSEMLNIHNYKSRPSWYILHRQGARPNMSTMIARLVFRLTTQGDPQARANRPK